MWVWRRVCDSLDSYEIAISSWMERHGYRLLRIAMGIGGVVRVGGREVARIGPNQFIGEMSFFTRGYAEATVEVAPGTRWVAWPHDRLRALVNGRTTLEHALVKTIALDLVGKVRNGNTPAVARSAVGE